MISLSTPWALVALALPWIARALLPVHRQDKPALYTPWFGKLVGFTGNKAARRSSVSRRSVARTLLFAVTWCLIVLALSRPQWVGPPIHKQIPTRDLMLIVDLSGSMDTEDFKDPSGKKVSRLEAVKGVVGDFLVRREGDRVGLIVFGGLAAVVLFGAAFMASHPPRRGE